MVRRSDNSLGTREASVNSPVSARRVGQWQGVNWDPGQGCTKVVVIDIAKYVKTNKALKHLLD